MDDAKAIRSEPKTLSLGDRLDIGCKNTRESIDILRQVLLRLRGSQPEAVETGDKKNAESSLLRTVDQLDGLHSDVYRAAQELDRLV